MNLNEEINRTKTLMGLQSINEGVFKQKGTLKDLLKNIFKKSETVINSLNQYEMKYGKDVGGSSVNGITLMNTSNEQTNKNVPTTNSYCTIGVITSTPQPLSNDNTKKSSNVTYSLIFQNTQGNNTSEYYEYFKSVYLIDGKQSDEISHIRVGQNFTCSTSTLEGKTGGCVISQEVKDKILSTFQNNKDFAQLQAYLNMVK